MHNLEQNGATETQRREQLGVGGVFVCVRLSVCFLVNEYSHLVNQNY